MLIPISWLKRYVPVDMPAKELAHRLTMAGLEIDEVREVGADWGRDKVVVGHVMAVDRHPNADRLTMPTLDLGGGETAQVVCGGPNLAVGQKIAFAHAGAMLYSTKSGKTQPLKRSKIRGIESAGMVCSEVELGLGEDHEGIMVLSEDAPVGTPLVDYLGDAVLDADVTPNRPDCLSILGVAHEVAALTGATVVEPDPTYPELGDPIERDVTVEIADPDLCSRYAASLIRGVTVGPSPDWLKDALASVGMRPINNIVDVTNYVMLEYGQPLHAFDFDTIRDSTVIVRAARPGEKFTTLDEEERSLDPPMLAIADSQDAIALAGVMGGQNTEVGDSTTNVSDRIGELRRNQHAEYVRRLRYADRGVVPVRARHPAGPRAPCAATGDGHDARSGGRSRGEGDHRRIPRRQDSADADNRIGAAPASAWHGHINRYDGRSVDLVGL